MLMVLFVQALINKVKSYQHEELRLINIHTIFSLAHHRHNQGKLAENIRDQLLNLAKNLENDTLLWDKLKVFVNVTKLELQQPPKKYRSKVFWEIYGLKYLKRAGWVRRGILMGETVAEHTFGVYLLALFFLPNKAIVEETSYDKEKILKMLLAHDLAEARIGDYTPFDDKGEKRREERKFFDEFLLLGDSPDDYQFKNIVNLWYEFDEGATYNARVAKNIDRIENLAQLFCYNSEGFNIHDHSKWEKDIINEVTEVGTEEGKFVLEQLLNSKSQFIDFLMPHLIKLQPDVMNQRQLDILSLQKDP